MFIQKIAKQFAKPEGFGGMLSTSIMNMINQTLYRCVFNERKNDHEAKILDIGYGNGYLLKKFLKQGYVHVEGIEISETMQVKVKQKLRNEIAQGLCNLQYSFIEDMKFENDRFDYVYSVNTIYFWSSLDRALQETHRICKRNAIFVLAFYDNKLLSRIPVTKHGFITYQTQEIEEACKRNGFRIKKKIAKRGDTALCYVCEVIKD